MTEVKPGVWLSNIKTRPTKIAATNSPCSGSSGQRPDGAVLANRRSSQPPAVELRPFGSELIDELQVSGEQGPGEAVWDLTVET
ncbi:hypothetical protein ACWFR5_13885 [Streptomyces sp. NPDC055092]